MDQPRLPLITVATVTYNAESTLPCTLESVASQTYPHIEHLIVDGCSKDQTMEQIHRYVDANTGKAQPHDIHVVREPDKGLYDAMNKALEQAAGDYIVFLNAGDRLHSPDTLQKAFAPLAGLSALMGHKAATICLVIANRATGDANPDYHPRMEELIEYTLNKLID